MPDSVLAFDFGLKRIGVAIGSLETKMAHPLTTIDDERNEIRFGEIEKLIGQWNPAFLVVGLPMNMDGSEHEMSRLCRRFANRLEGRFNLPAKLVDERLSSFEASESLKHMGIKGKKQKDYVDQLAAQHILQAFLDTKNEHS